MIFDRFSLWLRSVWLLYKFKHSMSWQYNKIDQRDYIQINHTVNMKFVQEWRTRYFLIDQKLGSNSVKEVNKALDDIDIILSVMNKIDLINSLAMRMLDLIQAGKIFYLKQRVAKIFQRHSSTLLSIHSKDEVATILSKCLKGSDQYTRIIAMQMIQYLPTLFLKDVAVYHALLAKISMKNVICHQEKKEAIICLSQLLSSSRHLSKLFSKNITEILKQYEISLHILIYLLTFVIIDNHLQKQILEQILSLVNHQKQAKTNKRQIKYYQKLVMNYASSNYRIVQFYNEKLKDILPNIQYLINKLQIKKYPFMKQTDSIKFASNILNSDELIQQLYQRKKQGNLLYQYQSIIKKIVRQSIGNLDEFSKNILFFYFIQGDFKDSDLKLKQNLDRTQSNSQLLLKKSLVVGLFQCSKSIISRLQIRQQNYIFLKLFIEFKITDNPESLLSFIEIIENLNKTISLLLKCWYLFSLYRANLSEANDKQQSVQILNDFTINIDQLQKEKKIFSLNQELQILSVLLANKDAELKEIKSKCYYILPSSILGNTRYWFAHLSKQTILQLFKSSY